MRVEMAWERAKACTKFVRMRSKVKCVRESLSQRSNARGAAGSDARGDRSATASAGDPPLSGDRQAIVRRDACRAPRILMHRNEAVARPPAVPN